MDINPSMIGDPMMDTLLKKKSSYKSHLGFTVLVSVFGLIAYFICYKVGTKDINTNICSTKKHIVVLGGNGFIGFEAIHNIIETFQPCLKLTLISRGQSNEFNRLAILKHHPYVHEFIKFDRHHFFMSSNESLRKLMHSEDVIHTVLDISGSSRDTVRDSVRFFRKKARLYIYISSDSVYEVCRKPHSFLTRETDDQRLPRIKKLARDDPYAHYKLEGEEALKKHAGDHMMYVILRLSDVIGFADSTDRWWLYQLWVHAAIQLNIPVYKPKPVYPAKGSLVYIEDVVKTISRIISMVDNKDSENRLINSINGQVFNLAYEDLFTVDQIIRLIEFNVVKLRYSDGSIDMTEFTDHMDTESRNLTISIDYFTTEDEVMVPHYYIYLERGPVSVKKAKERLDWAPSRIEDAVADIVLAYENIHDSAQEFVQEKRYILELFLEEVNELYDEEMNERIQTSIGQILNVK